ncbi:polysaccharide biosynthesis protein [Limnochorda pilosa]|uniref:Polysaccharide biosynthesis protein CapD n=1 Tax=Limnochorda pilosa TaxID=1555112 RepID=A0A0K2SLT8_LIMPI|nr:nucleoside-diphosphate sugar epimerase/dehydratase [Limnochorda pilosa]BAS28083.1 polysaccharide biosynthesis protein CapD [Limnochorda pilosa]
MTLREIRQATNWTVVGFVDDDPEKHRQRVLGLPVLGGREEIPELVRQHRVTQVLIAMPSAPRSIIRGTLDQARRSGCTVRTVPALYELMDGQITVNQIREVRIEDLLRRDPVPSDVKAVRSYLEGKVVLVTGAGGSIGSELCRQVARCAPGRLILLGHGENSIFEILEELRTAHPQLVLVTAIADMRDERKVEAIFAAHRPAVFFHAAAHKHVPLMEAHPDEAATNNVFGTLNLCLAADRFGTERFVMVSTDKAVNPTNAMGASKRVAEMVVQTMDRRSRTRFVAVRFGNVLGSRGSVIPTFKRQIAAGGPVTVTHPEMRRYFMTIPEAVQLILEAGHLAQGGEIYLLEMGEPVRIVDLARDMIRLSGFEPDVDIPIVFTDARPGERLFEELRTDGENVEGTSHPDIVRLHGQEVDPAWLEHGLEVLRVQVREGELEALRATLVALGQGREPEVAVRVAEVAAGEERQELGTSQSDTVRPSTEGAGKAQLGGQEAGKVVRLAKR